MSFATWNDSYSVRVQRIDSEHQQLFVIVNNLYEAMKGGRGRDVLQPVLQELVAYTQQHFRNEEALLRQAGYADLAAHIVQHQKFVNRIQQLSNEYQAGATAITVELLDFLKNWLTGHIMGTDQHYSAALHASGIH